MHSEFRKRLVENILEERDNTLGVTISVESPFDCSYCPFNASTNDAEDEIANDPSEAIYICPILQKEVWGENPECEDELQEAMYTYLAETMK